MLALAVGSSSARARAYGMDGRALPSVPTASDAYAWPVTPDGGMQTDADAPHRELW